MIFGKGEREKILQDSFVYRRVPDAVCANAVAYRVSPRLLSITLGDHEFSPTRERDFVCFRRNIRYSAVSLLRDSCSPHPSAATRSQLEPIQYDATRKPAPPHV